MKVTFILTERTVYMEDILPYLKIIRGLTSCIFILGTRHG